MKDHPGETYVKTVSRMIATLAERECGHMQHAARAVADTLRTNGTIYAFGTGHSTLLVQELYYRAGGLVRVQPILFEGLMLHSDARLSTDIERLQGLAEALFARHGIGPGDVLFMASHSGGNTVVCDFARLAVQAGATVVAITSRAHATSAASRTNGAKLHEIAQIVIDNQGEPGDAAIQIPGLSHSVGPTSTVLGATILNAVVVEAVALLADQGLYPDVYVSSNLAGGDSWNAAAIAHGNGA